MTRSLALVAVLLSLPVSEAFGQATTRGYTPSVFLLEDETLKGVTTVSVLMEETTELKNQFSRDSIKNTVELRLRQTGITVLDIESNAALNYPHIHLAVSIMSGDVVTYSGTLSLVRRVIIPTSDKNVIQYTNAPTWQTGHFGTVGSSKAAAAMKEVVDDMVTEFLKKYLEQNPKK